MSGIVDLTGTWHGRFSFPRLYPPVSFTAVISHVDDWIQGSTEEHADRGPDKGSVITATLSGRVTHPNISFLKTYDRPTRPYDAVQYEGAICSEGLEISGTWSIFGAWSGTFLMIRSSGPETAATRRTSEEIGQFR